MSYEYYIDDKVIAKKNERDKAGLRRKLKKVFFLINIPLLYIFCVFIYSFYDATLKVIPTRLNIYIVITIIFIVVVFIKIFKNIQYDSKKFSEDTLSLLKHRLATGYNKFSLELLSDGLMIKKEYGEVLYKWSFVLKVIIKDEEVDIIGRDGTPITRIYKENISFDINDFIKELSSYVSESCITREG
ncbi:hypothetical protein JHL18_07835 [Clostridium sp. YIM B02505]|uniref:YcxB-like protein domain-containing protein n=1 Tax=Clostridium yunnanense TaxID=2800325 RepID=A0ABS1EMG4_9CLOT|nr:hypothetical protein [Clostridium yunnanense]MBK1810544.1 hypothetical protein [Clostridium yunnanense]